MQVDLPEDPNLKGFHGSKPQFVSRKSQQRRTSTDAEAKKEEVVEAGLAPPSPEATHDSATGSDAGTPRSKHLPPPAALPLLPTSLHVVYSPADRQDSQFWAAGHSVCPCDNSLR